MKICVLEKEIIYFSKINYHCKCESILLIREANIFNIARNISIFRNKIAQRNKTNNN